MTPFGHSRGSSIILVCHLREPGWNPPPFGANISVLYIGFKPKSTFDVSWHHLDSLLSFSLGYERWGVVPKANQLLC